MAQETIVKAVQEAVEVSNAFTVLYVSEHGGGGVPGTLQGTLAARPLASAGVAGFTYNATDQSPPQVYQCVAIGPSSYAWYLEAAGTSATSIRVLIGAGTSSLELSSTLPAALGTGAIGVGTTAARSDHVHELPTPAQLGALALSALSNATPEGPGSPDPGASLDVSRSDHVHSPPTPDQVGLGVVTATGATQAEARNAIGALSVTLMTANGDLITRTGGVPARIPATVNGYVLTLSAGAPAWAAPVGFANPMTTDGDLITQATGIPKRLGIGTNGYVLTSTGAAAVWAAAPGGAVTEAQLRTAAAALTAPLAVNAQKITNLSNGTISSDAATLSNVTTQVNGVYAALPWKATVTVRPHIDVNLSAPGFPMDGIAMSSGDTFLADLQNVPSEDGIYTWLGPAVAAVRLASFGAPGAHATMTIVSVQQGSSRGKTFRCTNDYGSDVIGTDHLVFEQIPNPAVAVTYLSVPVTVPNITTTLGTVDEGVFTFSAARFIPNGAVGSFIEMFVTGMVTGPGLTGRVQIFLVGVGVLYTLEITSNGVYVEEGFSSALPPDGLYIARASLIGGAGDGDLFLLRGIYVRAVAQLR